MKQELDSIDLKILDTLQQQARITLVDLAERVALSKTPCAERLKKLERSGYIRGYQAQLDAQKLGFSQLMIVQVSLQQTSNDALQRFNRAVSKIPEVQSCFMVAAHFDYLLLVRTRDIEHFRSTLGDEIGQLPNIQQTHSYMVMEQVVERCALPISP